MRRISKRSPLKQQLAPLSRWLSERCSIHVVDLGHPVMQEKLLAVERELRDLVRERFGVLPVDEGPILAHGEPSPEML